MRKITASLVVFNPNIPRVLETLDSLFKDYPDMSLVVVDNSLEKSNIENDLKRFINLKYFWVGENLGFGTGHNLALKHCEPSQFHLIVNPDITVKSGCTATLLSFLENNVNVGLVGPKTLNPDGTIQYSCKRNPSFLILMIRSFFKKSTLDSIKFLKDYNAKYEMRDFDYNTVFATDYISGCFMMVRRDVFERIKGFDEDFFLHFEDADLTRRLNKVSQTRYVPQAEVIHDWIAGKHKSLHLSLIMAKSALIYFKKWGFSFFKL